MTPDQVIEKILAAFDVCGHLDYGEEISMGEHMLQAAHLAEKHGESDDIVIASLLHDYGHLVCNLPNDTFYKNKDNYHESVGNDALKDWFPEHITVGVKLHVEAKRYLCAVKPSYIDKLSEASIMTLKVQGGPMSNAEIKKFEAKQGHEVALKVRIYDDLGKEPRMDRPDLDYYIPKLKACLTK